MSLHEAWTSTPGTLMDVFLWRREYDDALHGIKREEDGDE